MLCCPVAPSTKAQPPYPNTPRCSAGNIWGSCSRLTTEAGELQWLWVYEACWERSARSFLLSDTLVAILELLGGVHFLTDGYKREHATYFWRQSPNCPSQGRNMAATPAGRHLWRAEPTWWAGFYASDSAPPCPHIWLLPFHLLHASQQVIPLTHTHKHTHIQMLWNGGIGQVHVIKCCLMTLVLI